MLNVSAVKRTAILIGRAYLKENASKRYIIGAEMGNWIELDGKVTATKKSIKKEPQRNTFTDSINTDRE